MMLVDPFQLGILCALSSPQYHPLSASPAPLPALYNAGGSAGLCPVGEPLQGDPKRGDPTALRSEVIPLRGDPCPLMAALPPSPSSPARSRPRFPPRDRHLAPPITGLPRERRLPPPIRWRSNPTSPAPPLIGGL